MNPKAEVGQHFKYDGDKYVVVAIRPGDGARSQHGEAETYRLVGRERMYVTLDAEGRYGSSNIVVEAASPADPLRALVARFCEDVDAAAAEAEARALASSAPERRDETLNTLRRWARDFGAAMGEGK